MTHLNDEVDRRTDLATKSTRRCTGIVFPSNRDALMIARSVVLHRIKSETGVDHAFLPMGTTDAEY